MRRLFTSNWLISGAMKVKANSRMNITIMTTALFFLKKFFQTLFQYEYLL